MKHFFFLSTLTVALLLASTALLSAADTIGHVDGPGALKLLKDKPAVVVLDIRTDKEYAAGHIAKARNIDFYGKDFADQLKPLDKSQTYLVHCASGGRSAKSLETFTKLGFKSVYHLDGGFKAWEKAGAPVEK